MRGWVLFAIVTRTIASFTQLSWGHPDEWYQTVEQANFLAHGFIAFTEGLSFHLRNLTWPAGLAGVLELAEWIAPGDISTRVWAVRAVTVLLDLSTLWGIHVVIERLGSREGMPEKWRRIAWVCLVFPWFLIWDSVRPSQEHLSQIAFWWALGMTARERYLAAGVFSALTGVFRYPSALLGAGIALSLAAKKVGVRRFGLFVAGAIVGIALGGVADWIVYGRPYESLWMYLQYNVFSGLGARNYGFQSGAVYLEHFRGHWATFLGPAGFLLAALAPVGLYYGFRRREPWAWAVLLYGLGHLAIGHKEPRFMSPIELALVLAAVYGAWRLSRERAVRSRMEGLLRRRGVKRAVLAGAVVLLGLNGLLAIKATWGETFRPAQTYLDIDRHLRSFAGVCAVVSVRKPLTPMLPWKRPEEVPSPAFAFFPARPHAAVTPGEGELDRRPLIWFERKPACGPDGIALLHLTRPDGFWSLKQGCELLPSGLLKILPRSAWSWAIGKKLVSGAWYKCPPQALAVFQKQEVFRLLATRMPHWEKLPPLGLTPEQLERLGAEKEEPGMSDGTLSGY